MVRQGYQPTETNTVPPAYVGIDVAALYYEEDNRYRPTVMNIRDLSYQIDELREEIRRLYEKVFKLESK
jgi:hypothetical protein